MSHTEYEDSRTYEAQARIISQLHKNIKYHEDRATRFEAKYYDIANDAMFYRVMIEAIQKHETLQEEWTNFVALLRMCEPDLEQEMKKKIQN
jgi:UTP-glucose-1-phosphate uridylyltransferase